MYSQRLVNTLNEIATEYGQKIKQSVTEVLNKYKNTGAGVSSVNIQITPGTDTKAPSIQITFDDHLIFLNKRRIEWTKLPDMKNMIAWAETKKSDPAEAKRMAFGVAWNKLKFDTWKPKTWRK